MTRVSRNRLLKDTEERIKDKIISLLTDIKDKNEMMGFFEEFFTPTEKVMFAKRLSIGILLLKGFEQRQISRILKVSTGTVTGMNTILMHKSGILKKWLEKIIEKEKGEENKENFIYGLTKELASLRGLNWKYTRRLAHERHKKHVHEV